MRRLTSLAAATLVASSIGMATGASAAVGTDTEAYRDAVSTDAIMEHLEAFQAIADANDDNRAASTDGYAASVDYVVAQLEAAGYAPTVQEFDFDYFAETAPAELVADGTAFVDGEDFATMSYSGSGDVAGTAEGVDLALDDPASSTSGCEASDFDAFTAGNIAVMQRGACSFAQKAANAEAAGAAAAIVFNQGDTEERKELFFGTLGDHRAGIPVLSASWDTAMTLLESETVEVFTETVAEVRQGQNVIADTPTGRDDRVVVVGAHLDSVPEGPGINDNGSGSATVLALAEAMAAEGIEPTNTVRFAFWGAEEFGLLGSEHYVANLTKAERKDIMLNLNFDMVGSPNYVRFVYDGDGSSTGIAGPNGSGHIESVFTDYFASQELLSEPTEFSGRSDYGPFIAVGIPAGGLFTGAEGVKTEQQALDYGGTAGEWYDPCYHAACDDIGNVSLDAIDEMSDAAAHATLTYAMTTSSVNGTDRASSKAQTGEMEYAGSHAQR